MPPSRRFGRVPREGLAALGGVRAVSEGAVARPRRVVARAGRRDGAPQRARRLHAAPGGRLALGRAGGGDRRVRPGGAGRVLRPRGRQGLPAPDLLQRPRGRGAPVSTPSKTLGDYVLGLADDALVSAQRMGWWISRAPQLEEDLALANIGLDQLGQARTLLSYAGQLEGDGRTEDDLAYLRDEREFRNVWLVERAQSDFGVTMARLLLFAAWQSELYAALASCPDPTLAGVAGKA